MPRKVLFLPDVRADFQEAAAYYDSLSLGLGTGRFRDAVKAAEAEVADGFVIHMKVFIHYHRVSVRKFPYTLFYRLRGEDAIVVGLLHTAFSPERIRTTLSYRT